MTGCAIGDGARHRNAARLPSPSSTILFCAPWPSPNPPTSPALPKSRDSGRRSWIASVRIFWRSAVASSRRQVQKHLPHRQKTRLRTPLRNGPSQRLPAACLPRGSGPRFTLPTLSCQSQSPPSNRWSSPHSSLRLNPDFVTGAVNRPPAPVCPHSSCSVKLPCARSSSAIHEAFRSSATSLSLVQTSSHAMGRPSWRSVLRHKEVFLQRERHRLTPFPGRSHESIGLV